MRILDKIIFSTFLFLMIVLLVFLNGCSDLKECISDSDCIKVQLDCCPCQSGGQETCVSRPLKQFYDEKLSHCLNGSDLLCIAKYNCEVVSCVCNQGTCDDVINLSLPNFGR